MDKRRSHTPGRLTRRRLLVGMGVTATVVGGASITTEAFSSVTGSRLTNLNVADDPDALISLLVNDTVRKNNRGLLVEIENNTTGTVDFSVTLDDPSHGTLYNNNPTLGAGSSQRVEITAEVKDVQVPFTIVGTSPNFQFEAARETTAVSGNTSGAVTIDKVKKFSANDWDENWTIQTVKVSSQNELDRVEYEVTDSNGETRATRTDTASGTRYVRKGQGNAPAITLEPDDSGYDVQGGTTYELTVTAFDVQNNFDSVTRTDTA